MNGVPVATAELKNPLTGQGVEHAVLQYRKDRDPKNRTLRRVGMVHFAVDPYSVSMTTHLVGGRTRFSAVQSGPRSGGWQSAQSGRSSYCVFVGVGVVP